MNYSNGYSGLAIADYFIKKALAQNIKITNTIVLRLIYLAQGFGFKRINRQLIRDRFYAWQWGPVEIRTYNSFARYENSPITNISNLTNSELQDIEGNPIVVEFLNTILKLARINPHEILRVLHFPKGPWDQTAVYSAIKLEHIREKFANLDEKLDILLTENPTPNRLPDIETFSYQLLVKDFEAYKLINTKDCPHKDTNLTTKFTYTLLGMSAFWLLLILIVYLTFSFQNFPNIPEEHLNILLLIVTANTLILPFIATKVILNRNK